MKLKLTQKNFDVFVDALNHRMTNIEGNVTKLQSDVSWVKKIGYYLASIVTAIAIKSIFF